MLYYKCPTCRTILANKQLLYENSMDNICKNDTLDKKQKDEAKKKLLDELELPNMCCRMRILTYIKLIEIIK